MIISGTFRPDMQNLGGADYQLKILQFMDRYVDSKYDF
jgi:hypothetical protein